MAPIIFFKQELIASMSIVRVLLFLVIIQYPLSAQRPAERVLNQKRQFRGVWIATVRNLDWPSKPGLNVRKMKKEYIQLLDKLKEIGMNAVVVQVRPVADAFYPSAYEPWSEFITGEQGKAPSLFFDPLEFMIEEAHVRCLEFHAWFNPYRAVRDIESFKLAPGHVYLNHPEWFVQYGRDTYFDPGMVPARKFVEKVIADVVSRYDIDAVHFDDYYYPYTLEGVEFPDSLSFSMYKGDFTGESIGDWRRENVNTLVRELYDTINYLKPWVHFGISPFGVWRNKADDPRGSETSTLQTNYDNLYGDALTWLKNGWLDYIVPQCYQYLGRPIMDYRVVAKWWSDNSYGANLYIGQGPFRLGTTDRGDPWAEGNEIARQLYFNDSIPNLQGSVYFRAKTFVDNPLGVNDTLKNYFYKFPALPPSSHLNAGQNNQLTFSGMDYTEKKKTITLTWETDFPEQARYYVVYNSPDINDPKNIVAITSETRLKLKKNDESPPLESLYLTVIDLYRKESQAYGFVIEN